MPPKSKRILPSALLNAKRKEKMETTARYREIVKEATENHLAYQETEKSLKSLWEAKNIDEFLSNAAEKSDGFAARRDVKVVVGGEVHIVRDNRVVPLTDKRDWLKLSEVLTIPKRPVWSFDMRPDEIQRQERQSFIEWRRTLAQLQESQGAVLTPYEKNLEVWRQLWRVVERSQLVLYIVDSRNPLTFRCKDFERYVIEFQKYGYPTGNPEFKDDATAASKHASEVKKIPVLLLNKADLLTNNQRAVWAKYFADMGIPFYFFSACETPAGQKIAEEDNGGNANNPIPGSDEDLDDEEEEELDSEESISEDDALVKKIVKKHSHPQNQVRKKRRIKGNPVFCPNIYAKMQQEAEEKRQLKLHGGKEPVQGPKPPTEVELERDARNKGRLEDPLPTYHVLSPVELVDELVLWRKRFKLGLQPNGEEEPITVGLVGYPNVGKSSTINAIFGQKRVVVSATPGKTKHFQTLSLLNERRVILCDCPGLVFPSFAATRETMICDGILPIDAIKDYTTAVGLITQRVPQTVLEAFFGFSLGEDADVDESYNLAERIMNIVARMRGYMSDHNKPNKSKVAKELLKHYVDGELVYVHAPPGVNIAQLLNNKKPTATNTAAAAAPKTAASKTEAPLTKAPVTAAQKTQPVKVSPPPEAASATDEEEDEEEEDWEDIEDAEIDRNLSDDEGSDESETEILDRARREKEKKTPAFFSKMAKERKKKATVDSIHQDPMQQLTNDELFNMERNQEAIQRIEELAELKKTQRRQHKRKVNHQLEPDFDLLTMRINKHGEKETLIDDDDGIVIAMPHPDDVKFLSEKEKEREKKKSKRQARRDEKKEMLAQKKMHVATTDF